ncbi:MAG: hypothetical protein OQK09_04605 [Colwellia sp.]|nr:hypothetical protein [Colwellia sp.]MCW8865995.1 hypothetical protein [Colwellia sp.]MCW9080769.1 hypothetical protein [Colwellia sp.]
MQLLRSLFCLQGFDNRTRFFAIACAIYLIFIMLASAFTGKLVISLLISLLFSAALGLTSLRRLHDAKLNKNWLFAPSVSFALVALIIIFSEQHSSYYLLLIPALSSAVLLTYPSKQQATKQSYTLGYIGPVDMSEYQQATHQGKSAKFRIEPSLAGESIMSLDEQQSAQQANTSYNVSDHQQTSQLNAQQADLGELIRLKLLSNKKAQIAVIVLVVIVLASVLFSWLVTFINASSVNDTESISEPPQKSISETIAREHPLAMPDNFTLYLSQHQGVIIGWQADEVDTPQLWSQISAQGDESCHQISFNKGKPIRTLTVDIESKNGANTEYFASFSPLDSQALIQALAFRGKFSLCGYDFSLKGSQAQLGKNEHYAHWVEY